MAAEVRGDSLRAPRPLRARLLAIAGALALAACSALPPWRSPSSQPSRSVDSELPDAAIYQRARHERTEYLEREVQRLQADLHQAEESMVAIESGLRGIHTRADAVSVLAESRITVERAARNAPWRPEQIAEARAKLEEAERQFQAGHSGSAVFFASRALRIAETLEEEAETVARSASARYVHGLHVNLRAGPSTSEEVLAVLDRETPVFPERSEGGWVMVRTLSGQVGWIHTSLLRHAR